MSRLLSLEDATGVVHAASRAEPWYGVTRCDRRYCTYGNKISGFANEEPMQVVENAPATCLECLATGLLT